jgi:uncharacterized protein YkwD
MPKCVYSSQQNISELIYSCMFKLYGFIAVLIIFFRIATLAQSPFEKPDETKLNVLFLEHLIKTQVDSVRRAHGLQPLVNDSILYIAAQDHAKYLSREKDISHFQRNHLKKTPQNRADFYGAQHYLVGENVLSYPIENTYISTAQNMVRGWVNSPGHFKNIITPEYQITGLAVARHPASGNYIAVQKFAKVLWRYSFHENKKMFTYSSDTVQIYDIKTKQWRAASDKEKLPWNLQPLDFKNTRSCEKCAGLFKRKFKITPWYENNRVYAISADAREVLKTFEHKQDGLAVEQVAYEPYHCGNPAYYTKPSRRNHNSSLDGEVFEPVYKRELLSSLKEEEKAFKKERRQKIRQLKRNPAKEARQELEEVRKSEWEPGYWTAFLMKLPATSKGYQSYNFLLIHDGEIHLPIYYTGVCGDLLFSDTLSMVTEFSEPGIFIKPTRKKFTFEIPFERNSIVPDSLSMLVMKDSIRNYQIDTIRVEAFSSVEGLENLNTSLHKKRASAIFSQIKFTTDSATVFQVQAKENWPLFYKQIANTKFWPWKDWEPAQIKKELQKPAVLQEWEGRLDEQRRATVTIKAHSIVRDTLAYVYKHYRIQKPGEALLMQDYLYSLWQQHRIPSDSIININYPYRWEYTSLISNQLVFNYQLHSGTWSSQDHEHLYNAFLKAAAIPRASNLLKYNYLVFVVNNWKSLQKERGVPAEKIYRLLNQLEKSGGYGSQMARLKALFFVKSMPTYIRANNIKRTEEGLETIYHFYSRDPQVLSSKDRTLSLARYFIELGDMEHAYGILNTYLNNNSFDKDIFAYYLKVAFIHPLYQKNREYVKLLMEARQLLSKEEWCDLFIGPCNINFQIFDDEELRNLYCESCADRGNYATSQMK